MEKDVVKRVDHKRLKDFCVKAMLKAGMSRENAEITADVLVMTDTWGVTTHGSKQLHLLLKPMAGGGLSAKAEPKVVSEGAGWALLDGNFAMPMVTAHKAMKLAIEKAKSCGIGYAGVRGSSHFGASGYYANMAAAEDMIGLSMSNVDPCVAVPGSKGAVMGTNPIAYAVPAGKEKPVFLDIATSVAAISKVLTAKAMGKKVPENWLVDSEGVGTTDPTKYPEEGAILPMAGHKGYGIAVLIEVLCGIITGALFTKDLRGWLSDYTKPINQGHAFIAIDIGAIMPIEQFKERMDTMIRGIKEAPKAKGTERIYLPGEMEWERREKALVEGILLPEDVVINLTQMAKDWELDLTEIF